MLFRYGRTQRLLSLAVGLIGLAAAALSLMLPDPWRPWAVGAGILIAAAKVGDAVMPIYQMDDEGILLSRSLQTGYYTFRHRLMILWGSIADVQHMGDDVVAVCLPDGIWIKLPIDKLSEADQHRFRETVRSRAVHASGLAHF